MVQLPEVDRGRCEFLDVDAVVVKINSTQNHAQTCQANNCKCKKNNQFCNS